MGKNKKQTKPIQDGTSKGSKPVHNEVNTRSANENLFSYFWSLLVLCLAIYAYLQPSVLYGFVSDWIGFSEHWDIASLSEGLQPVVAALQADAAKQEAVVQAFKHAWLAYERDAMGADEYHPISREGTNLTSAGGIGFTVADTLDTMLIMGLNEEYQRARRWVEDKLTFDKDGAFSTFETTIRVLGGLLSALHLTHHDPVLLQKAVDLADRILPVFDTPSGLPLPVVNLGEKKGYHTTDYPGLVSIAEIGTLQLEFRYLSEVTGNSIYWEKAEKIMEIIHKARLPHGMASIFMDIDDGQYITSPVRLGSRADSKQFIQTGYAETIYMHMYFDAMTAIQNHLVQKTKTGGYTYTSELQPERQENGEISWRLVPKQDHLTCFLAGSLMLGAVIADPRVPRNRISRPPSPGQLSEYGLRDWKFGSELLKTCLHTHDTATGLSPEIVHFRIPSDGMDGMSHAPSDWYIKGAKLGEPAPYTARYMLRPETVESLFIAYRLTGDERYREYGWNIFQAIEKHCRVETGGYATILNVDQVPTQKEDKMETFFLSETLKYLYLLFSDDSVIPLDRYVLNTEAHPLPIFTPTVKFR
ncbi:mannosyl-oligosaccharide alpha-1,2-mannosidase [Leucoagaricus gongylophorus]